MRPTHDGGGLAKTLRKPSQTKQILPFFQKKAITFVSGAGE
jgi:hypothetical protein